MNDAQQEAEANQFAMELLMPERLVRCYLAAHGGIDLSGDGADVAKMARAFGVPATTMGIRIGQICPSANG